jgi:hypothetical protein
MDAAGFEIVAVDQDAYRLGRVDLTENVADAGVHGLHVRLQDVDAVDDIVLDVLDAAGNGMGVDVRGQIRHLLGRFDALRVAHAVVGKGIRVGRQDHGGSIHPAKKGPPTALVDTDFICYFLVVSRKHVLVLCYI